MHHSYLFVVFIFVYGLIQAAYFFGLAVQGYFYSRWIDWIHPDEVAGERTSFPPIVLLYPVLHEAKETMRTTMLSIDAAQAAYRPGRARVVAIPNHDDLATVVSLEELTAEFDFLEILSVPPTTDASWAPVWSNWDMNSKAYWWHVGKRTADSALPAKKTRQMVYALYAMAQHLDGDDWLLSYLDADSAVPVDYFRIAAAGADRYDVVQLTNVAGNLMASWAASFHAMDHMAWDGSLYPHMSSRGRHPFYVLGKGLFFKVSDLIELGGFNPWLTIEDPEVGMRLWVNGRTLGVSDSPLIEEVPSTFGGGITQRKRWVAGFFQSLHVPLALMGMSFRQRMKARLNLVPVLSLVINSLGLPLGVWVVAETLAGHDPINVALTVLSVVNIFAALAVLTRIFYAAWVRSKMVLDSRKDRLLFLARVNPLFLIGYWLVWLVPLAIGAWLFMADRGLTWQRTVKVDANHDLVRSGHGLGEMGRDTIIDLRDNAPEAVALSDAVDPRTDERQSSDGSLPGRSAR